MRAQVVAHETLDLGGGMRRDGLFDGRRFQLAMHLHLRRLAGNEQQILNAFGAFDHGSQQPIQFGGGNLLHDVPFLPLMSDPVQAVSAKEILNRGGVQGKASQAKTG